MCLDDNTCEMDMTPYISYIIVGQVAKKRLLFIMELDGVPKICLALFWESLANRGVAIRKKL